MISFDISRFPKSHYIGLFKSLVQLNSKTNVNEPGMQIFNYTQVENLTNTVQTNASVTRWQILQKACLDSLASSGFVLMAPRSGLASGFC